MGISFIGFVAFAKPAVILHAAIATLAITAICSLIRCQAKYDFTKWSTALGGVFLGVVLLSILAGVFAIFFPQIRILHLVFAIIFSVLFSIYIIIEVQRIVGGKSETYGTDDYIAATLNIYMPLVPIFRRISKKCRSKKKQ